MFKIVQITLPTNVCFIETAQAETTTKPPFLSIRKILKNGPNLLKTQIFSQVYPFMLKNSQKWLKPNLKEKNKKMTKRYIIIYLTAVKIPNYK